MIEMLVGTHPRSGESRTDAIVDAVSVAQLTCPPGTSASTTVHSSHALKSGERLAAQGIAATASSSVEELSFRFVSGHRALDLAATLGDRYRGAIERLREPVDLERWLAAAGISAHTPARPNDLAAAHQLREVIYRLARATLYHESVDGADLEALNAWARTPRLAPQLGARLQREWASSQPISGALALVACDAVELLSGPERQLIRECAATPACSLLYLDRLRGRRRRWCQMETCGSRAKMAEYRKRRGVSTEDGGWSETQ